MSSFTDRLWFSVRDIYEAILAHPFLTGLTDGSLDLEVFRGYIIQDALYLSRFAKAVALVGAKAPDDDAALTLISAARDALSVERATLHDFLLSQWGIRMADLQQYQMTPTNRAYTDFLIASAYEKPFLIGLSAILPCFWVYLEVGRELSKKGSPVETYSRWINTYSSPDYEQAVDRIIRLAGEVGASAGAVELEEAELYFRVSTIYEYLFWDSAHRREAWPFVPKR
ncbi:MAG: thiaminase II [Nitrososphaerota archaeon]